MAQTKPANKKATSQSFRAARMRLVVPLLAFLFIGCQSRDSGSPDTFAGGGWNDSRKVAHARGTTAAEPVDDTPIATKKVVAKSPPSAFPTVHTTGITKEWCPRWGELKRSTSGRKIRKDGAVIEYEDINGSLMIDARNVVIRCSKITTGFSGRSLWGILCSDGGWSGIHGCTDGLLIEDTTLWMGNTDTGIIMSTDEGTINRTRVRPGCDATKIEGGLLSNSYLGFDRGYTHPWKTDCTQKASDGGHHSDGAQQTGANGPLWILNNTIFGPYRDATSAIILKGDFGDIHDVTIDGNQLSGGSNTVNLKRKNKTATNYPDALRMTNNVWIANTPLFRYLNIDSTGSECHENKQSGRWTNKLSTGEDLDASFGAPSQAGDIGSCGGSATWPRKPWTGITTIPRWSISGYRLAASSCTQGQPACDDIDLSATGSGFTPRGTNPGSERWRFNCGGSPSNTGGAHPQGADLWYDYDACDGRTSCTMTDVCDFRSEGVGTYTVKVYSEPGPGAGIRPSDSDKLTFTVE
jgi:hypothetical protein